MAAKPGRNDPCSCGSGRKYKHCHGELSRAEGHPGPQQTPYTPQLLTSREIGAMVTMVDQGRLSDAEASVRDALNSHPTAGILWKILSVTLVRQRKDALQALHRAAELLPNDAEALRNLGAALHDRAEWPAALNVLHRALAIEPNDPETLADAADATRGIGRVRDSLPLYERALCLDPQLVEARNNLGNAYLELAQYADAVECYRTASKLQPGDALILCNLGNALHQAGHPDEALAACEQAVSLDPELSAAHNYLGLVLAARGRREEAVSSYNRALRLDPVYVEALNNLGNAQRELGQRRSAIPLYRRAVELDPTRAESHCNLGNALFELRQTEEAMASYRQALTLQPGYAPAHLGLAYALRQQRRPADAEISCAAALAGNPNYVEARSFLGELRSDAGHFAAAAKLFQQAIDLDPGFSFAVASIATHRRMTAADTEWLHRAEALLARRLPLADEISVRYALGKYFDDIGKFDPAFSHYRQANELTKRYGTTYNKAGLIERIDRIIGSFATVDPGFVGRASDSEVPVLIVGMPRSGTSLTEQILASHPQVFGGGEVTFWNSAYDAFRDAERKGGSGSHLIPGMATRYLEQLAAMSGGAARVIDKMPANFMYAGLIHAAFPCARIIHMRRHPIDTCLSIYFQNFFNIGPYANDLEDLAHYYSEYVRITDHWRATLPATAFLEVPYEALVADQEGWTRRMLDFVGLPWDPACLDFHTTERAVITASRWQVRQKISATSAGRWRHYEKYVAPLRRLC